MMLHGIIPETGGAKRASRLMNAHILSFTGSADADIGRVVPIEVPIALEYDGIGYAVMMATPADLEEFAIGFTLSEGLTPDASSIRAIDIHEVSGGWVARVSLAGGANERVLARARTRVSESSCGLCGIDSIEQILRPLPEVRSRLAVERAAIARALGSLTEHQPLGRSTGAAHAAAFVAPDGEILLVREDVGRHNALDKLVGGLHRVGVSPGGGFVLLSARCSYELVEKTVRAGCAMLVTISAPTSLAVERAKACGLALGVLARPDSMLVMNDPGGCFQ